MFKKILSIIDDFFSKNERIIIDEKNKKIEELKQKLNMAEQQLEEMSSVMSNYGDSNKFLVMENNQLRSELEKINQNNEIIAKFKEFVGELEFQELISLSNVLVK
jgi:regulator of replication initiation timing